MGLRFSVGSVKFPRRLSRAGRLPSCASSPAATIGKPLTSRAARLTEARNGVRTPAPPLPGPTAFRSTS